MSGPPPRGGGDPRAARALEAWAAGRLPGRVLHDNPRRQLVRLEAPEAGPLLLKRFRTASGRHVLRERVKGRLGAGPADREWRALTALHAAGVPVPEPLARTTLPGGDPVLALRWVEGRPLREALGEGRKARRKALDALARSVAALHAAGWVHGDLHHGNVLMAGGAAVLLDLQRARRRRGPRARRSRLRDLGWLDHSLWPDLSRTDRVRLRAGALGLARPFDPRARRALVAVGRAALRRSEAHARSRTRRSLRPGRLYARHGWGVWRGLRRRELAAEAVDEALRGHALALAAGDRRVLKDDRRSRVTAQAVAGRRVVVKEAPPRGAGRALADVLRGSAGRRAWLGGHGLRARGVGAALPLAFLERRALGVPVASVVVLEDLRPARPADEATEPDAGALLGALADLACTLHRRGVDHGDLKASHVFVRPGPRGLEARILDLEGVRFRRRLSDARRIQALAELNASLPDRLPARARRAAFARYAAALPFADGAERALGRVVERSLERRHRWTGADCTLAETTHLGERRC